MVYFTPTVRQTTICLRVHSDIVLYDGIIANLSDSNNVGILVFLVMLGIIVCLMNRSGGSAAFGRWAKNHIHSRMGAQLATIVLGVLIFVDDYFNCLTVGKRNASYNRKSQSVLAKTGIPDRRYCRSGMYHRSYFILGSGSQDSEAKVRDSRCL